jgi:hypothetical protein
MSARYITAGDLVDKDARTSCCDCPSVADAAPPEQMWVKNDQMIYCPKCAVREGIEPEE